MRIDDIDEDILAGELRAEVSYARDNGQLVDGGLAYMLGVADLLELPDDIMIFPAVAAAVIAVPVLKDAEILAYAREVALAAGRGNLGEDGQAH